MPLFLEELNYVLCVSKLNIMKYIPELNGMRGLSIIPVLLIHSGIPHIRGGFVGVDIFFVLSGFLITSLLIKEFDSNMKVDLNYFYKRRIKRLFPVLFILLFSVFILSRVISDKIKLNFIDVIIPLTYLTNWSRAFGIHPPDLLAHTWSLAVEWQFYLLLPVFIIGLLKYIRNKYIIIAIVFCVAVMSWAWRSYLMYIGTPAIRLFNGLDTRMDILLIGSILAILLNYNLIKKSKLSDSLLLFLVPFSVVGLITFFIFTNWYMPELYYWIFTLEGIFVSIIIFDIFVGNNMLKQILSMKWLVWVGSISYGIYLYHFPIYKIMQRLNYSISNVVIIGTLLTLIVSTLSFYMIEKPILKLKKIIY